MQPSESHPGSGWSSADAERHEVAAWWYGVLFIAVIGSVGSLTVLFRSMRAVVETGASSCASGGAYVIANPCPKGVAAMIT